MPNAQRRAYVLQAYKPCANRTWLLSTIFSNAQRNHSLFIWRPRRIAGVEPVDLPAMGIK